MDNVKSISAVNASRFAKRFTKPLYGSYSFASIPGTVETLLTGTTRRAVLPNDVLGGSYDTFDIVVLFFVDAFSWTLLEKYTERLSVVSNIRERSHASKITSLFPSTTAVHVTAINTGLTPVESGICEWFYYDSRVDDVIAPLLFSFAGDDRRDTLLHAGIQPAAVIPQSTYFTGLSSAGVSSTLLLSSVYAKSSYGSRAQHGAEIIPFESWQDGLVTLRDEIKQTSGKRYFLYYFDSTDEALHRQGPDGEDVDTIVAAFFERLDREILSHPALSQALMQAI